MQGETKKAGFIQPSKEGRGDLFAVFNYLMRRQREDKAKLYTGMYSKGTQGTGHKLEQRQFQLIKIIYLLPQRCPRVDQVDLRGHGD